MDTLVMANDHLGRLLDSILGQIKDLNLKVDGNQKEIHKRINELEDKIAGNVTKKDMPTSPLHNPKVLQILLYLAIAIVLGVATVATIIGVDIKGIIS